jgi:L-iditol 2-dehydrogenase
MFTRLLVLRGVSVVATDLLQTRLSLAAKFGANHIVNVGKAQTAEGDLFSVVQRITHGRGVDAAVVAVPDSTVVRQAQELVRGAGQVLLFSHTKRGEQASLDMATICVDEKDLIGSYSADFTLQNQVARLIFSRKLDVHHLVTHEFRLVDTAAAVELAAHPTAESLKVVVNQEIEVRSE